MQTEKSVSRREFLKLGGAGLAGGLLLGAAGCGNSESAGGSGSSGGSKLRIAVTHYPTLLPAVPYEVGQEKGFFQEAGVEIERVLTSSGGGTTVRNVLSGDLDFGDVAGAAAVQSHLSGPPLNIVSGTVSSLADGYLVTRKDAPFEKPRDLVGKNWGYSNPGSLTQTASLVILEKIGISPSSIKFRAAGGLSEGLTLLKEGSLDAAPLFEPAYTTDKENWKTLMHFSDYVSEYLGDVLITKPQMIEQSPELVRKFINARQKSAEWIYQNHEEASKIYAKHAEIDREAASSIIQTAIDAKFWDNALRPKAINNMVRGMQLAELFGAGDEIDWKELLNQSALSKEKRVDVSTLDTNQ